MAGPSSPLALCLHSLFRFARVETCTTSVTYFCRKFLGISYNSVRMASSGHDSDPGGRLSKDFPLTNQSPIKDTQRRTGTDSLAMVAEARQVVGGCCTITSGSIYGRNAEEQEPTGKSPTQMKAPIPHTSPVVSTYVMSGMAIDHLQDLPVAGTSAAENAITISDESSEWKDSSKSTALAARAKKKADRAAIRAPEDAKKATVEAVQKPAEATKADKAEKAAKAIQVRSADDWTEV